MDLREDIIEAAFNWADVAVAGSPADRTTAGLALLDAVNALKKKQGHRHNGNSDDRD
jgi:hypothetical protein